MDDETDVSTPQYITRVAIEISTFLRDMQHSDDKWTVFCANLLVMPCDSLDFITAMRLGDAISIEHGY